MLLLWITRRFAKQLRTGDIFLLYLIWVPLGRFLLEFLRTDSWFFPGTPFNTAHILTATAVICGATFLFLRHRHAPAMQQAGEPQSNQEHTQIPLEAIQEPSEPSTEPQQSTATPVDSHDTSEPSETSLETLAEDTHEPSEPSAEPQQNTATPADSHDANEPSQASPETQGDPQKMVTVSSKVNDRPSNAPKTDGTGIEHS